MKYIEEVDLLCGGNRICARCVHNTSCVHNWICGVPQICGYLLDGLNRDEEERMDLILDVVNSTMDCDGMVDLYKASGMLYKIDKYPWKDPNVIISLMEGGYWIDAFLSSGKRLLYNSKVVQFIETRGLMNKIHDALNTEEFNRSIINGDEVGATLRLLAPDLAGMPRGYRLAHMLNVRDYYLRELGWMCLFGCTTILGDSWRNVPDIPRRVSGVLVNKISNYIREQYAQDSYVSIDSVVTATKVYEYLGRDSVWVCPNRSYDFMEILSICSSEYEEQFQNYIRHWPDIVDSSNCGLLQDLAENYRGQELSVHPSQIILGDTRGHNDSLLKAELELGRLLDLPWDWNIFNVPVLVDTEIPSVEIQSGEYKLRRLDRNGVDVYRGLFLGLYTDCCQHPDGEGSFCAFHGTENPLGGFYVVEKRGKIQAQAWAWIDKETSTLVLDNVECLGGLRDSVKNLFVKLADVLANDYRVVVGLGYSDVNWSEYPDDEQQLASICDMGYTDARSRKVLAERRAL